MTTEQMRGYYYWNINYLNMTGVKGKSGGYREGSGLKPKYGEETTVIRVPLSLVPVIQKMLKKLADKQAKKKKK